MWERIKKFAIGFRTFILNASIALIVVGAELTSFLIGFDWKAIVPMEYVPYAIIVVNGLNIFLRYMTTTPMFKKEPMP